MLRCPSRSGMQHSCRCATTCPHLQQAARLAKPPPEPHLPPDASSRQPSPALRPTGCPVPTGAGARPGGGSRARLPAQGRLPEARAPARPPLPCRRSHWSMTAHILLTTRAPVKWRTTSSRGHQCPAHTLEVYATCSRLILLLHQRVGRSMLLAKRAHAKVYLSKQSQTPNVRVGAVTAQRSGAFARHLFREVGTSRGASALCL